MLSAQEHRLKLPDEEQLLVPSFKSNLHWLTRALSAAVVATPLAHLPSYTDDEQVACIEWVDRVSLHAAGATIKDRCLAWYRSRDEQRVLVKSEHDMEPMTEEARLWPPWLGNPQSLLTKEEPLDAC